MLNSSKQDELTVAKIDEHEETVLNPVPNNCTQYTQVWPKELKEAFPLGIFVLHFDCGGGT